MQIRGKKIPSLKHLAKQALNKKLDYDKSIAFFNQFYSSEHSEILANLPKIPSDHQNYLQTLRQVFNIIYTNQEKIPMLFADEGFHFFYYNYISQPASLFRKSFPEEINLNVLDPDECFINLQRINCISLYFEYLTGLIINKTQVKLGNIIFDDRTIICHIRELHNYFENLLPKYRSTVESIKPDPVTIFYPFLLIGAVFQSMPQFHFLDDRIFNLFTFIIENIKRSLSQLPSDLQDREIITPQINDLLAGIRNNILAIKSYRVRLANFVKEQINQLADEPNYIKKKFALQQCVFSLENNSFNEENLINIELQDPYLTEKVKQFGHVELAIDLARIIEMLKVNFAAHTDTGVVGFFKATWARATTSKQKFDLFIGENPLPSCIAEIALVVQNDFHKMLAEEKNSDHSADNNRKNRF